KIPLLILSAAACVETVLSQRQSINLIKTITVGPRIANAFVTLITYLGQTVWPANLAVFYPHPENNIRAWHAALGVSLCAAASGAALLFPKKTPSFFTGWFWFVGMLVPVIGIVQVGIQAHADRYMYLPQIGLSLIFVWATVDLSATWRHRQFLLS